MLSLLLLLQAGVPALDRPPLLSEVRSSFAAATLDGRLFAHGGHAGEAHDYNCRDGRGDLVELDLSTGATRTLAATDLALQGHALVAARGGLIVIGGMTALNEPGEEERLRSSAAVRRYDLAAGTWSDLPPLPEPRSSFDAALCGGQIVVAGGWNLQPGAAPEWHDTVCVLDLSAAQPAWREIAAPFQRRGIAVAAAGGRVMVLGGLQPNEKFSARTDVLDLAAETWTEGANLPGFAFGAAAATLEGAVFASGRDGRLFRAAPDGSSWTECGTLLFPRFFHRLLPTADGRLMAVGGRAADGPALCSELLDPRRSAPGARAVVQEFTLPEASRNRQAIALAGGTLHLIGGNHSLAQHDFAPEDFSDRHQRLHLASLRAETGSALTRPLQSALAFAAEDRLLVVGGFGFDGEHERSLEGVLQWSQEAKSWSAAPAGLPQPRTQAGATFAAGVLHLYGGWDFSAARSDDDAFPLEVLRWDLADADGPAPTGAVLPRGRRAFACTAHEGRAWLVGGMGAKFATVVETDVHDPETGAWSAGPPLPYPVVGGTLLSMDGRLILVGGSMVGADGKSVAHMQILELSADGDAWETLVEELPFAPRHAHFFQLQERLVALRTHFSEPGRAMIAWMDLPERSMPGGAVPASSAERASLSEAASR